MPNHRRRRGIESNFARGSKQQGRHVAQSLIGGGGGGSNMDGHQRVVSGWIGVTGEGHALTDDRGVGYLCNPSP